MISIPWGIQVYKHLVPAVEHTDTGSPPHLLTGGTASSVLHYVLRRHSNSLHSAAPWVGGTALPVQSEAQLEPCFTCTGPQASDASMSLWPVPEGLLAAQEYVGHQLKEGMA